MAEKDKEKKQDVKAPKENKAHKKEGQSPKEEQSSKKKESSGPDYPKGMSPLEKKYRSECVSALKGKFGYKNVMQVPRLTKIVVNTSLKEAVADSRILQGIASELGAVCGQKPVITKAKKSIANFKIRKGISLGCAVTLRRQRMYEFMSRLVNVAMPRVKDFKGVSPGGFDGRGNYTLGLTEQTIFPEVNFDKVQKVYGMNITFVTSAKNDEEGKALLMELGMPFRK